MIKWFAFARKVVKDELVKAVFLKIITTENIEELICDPWLAL